MFEVELKVPVEHDSLREKLHACGATHVGTAIQVDVYFDAPMRDFSITDEALRLRRERREDDVRIEITYKGPKLDEGSKAREELETTVGDFETMTAILEAIDFDPVATVEKTRERYHHDGFTVSLDSVVGLGEFVEIETTVAKRGGISKHRRRAVEILDSLAVDADRQIRRSYLELLLERRSVEDP